MQEIYTLFQKKKNKKEINNIEVDLQIEINLGAK